MVAAGCLHCGVITARKHVDSLVMVDRAEHIVEIHPSVEKAPCDVAHQCTQKIAGIHRVTERPAVIHLPADVAEIFIAAESKAADCKILVTVTVRHPLLLPGSA